MVNKGVITQNPHIMPPNYSKLLLLIKLCSELVIKLQVLAPEGLTAFCSDSWELHVTPACCPAK